MMHKDLFSDGISRIDPNAVERTLRIERELERRAAGRKRRRTLAILAAAVLTLALASVLLIVPFIPTTLDIEYEPTQGMPERTWVYYVDESGKQQRELVKQPQGAQNVFASWQHLNEVDEQVQLLNYAVTTEPMAGTTDVPDTLWEFLMQQMGKRDEQTIVTATLSPGITSYENQDALIESLIQTIAKYAGISPEQVRILIDGETIGIIGPLQFWHNLQGGGDVIIGTGDTLEITVGMTNISDQPIYYTGSSSAFVPDATLRLGNTVIEHEIYPHTEDEAYLTLAPGESREVTYRFAIPADAPTGLYDLTVSFKGQSFPFTQAVQVVETTVPDVVPALEFYHSPSGISTTLGSTVSISVGMLNISNVPLYFTGSRSEFVPDAVLHMDDVVIHHEVREITGEYNTHVCRVGEAIEVTHIFQIPDNIPAGTYDLTISFAGQSLTLTDAVTILSRQGIDTSFDSDTLFDYEMQYKPTYEDYLQIQKGMTVEEVVEILGKPHYRDSATGNKYLCWETADGASCAIKVVTPHATEGWTDWADILRPHYGGATVVYCNYYGTVPDQDGK